MRPTATQLIEAALFLRQLAARYPWFQLAGHSDQFVQHRSPEWILKAVSENEKTAFLKLSSADAMNEFVPNYKGLVHDKGKEFIQLQNLLFGFHEPSGMDCKIGFRTFLSEDVASKAPRLDLLVKLDKMDPDEATAEERKVGITKLRYMEYREKRSSTASLGFRIEAVKMGKAEAKTFKATSMTAKEIVVQELRSFVHNNDNVKHKFIDRLTELKAALIKSDFFRRHECVGSSLLMLHDKNENIGVWMIDFGKTVPVEKDLDHFRFTKDNLATREDGYLLGLKNLIDAFASV